MGEKINKLKAYLLLSRFGSAGAPGFIATAGAACIFGTIFNAAVWFLFLLGVLIFIFGIAFNDLIDLEHDKLLHKDNKPLITGDLTVREAKIFLVIIFLIFFSFGIYLSGLDIIAMGLFIVSTIFGIVYDLISKKYVIAPIFMGLWLFFLVLYSSAVAGKINGFVTLVALCAALQMILATGCIGSVKDLQTDRVSFPRALGCHVKDNKLYTTKKYNLFSLSLAALAFGIVYCMLLLLNSDICFFVLTSMLVSLYFYSNCRLHSRIFYRKRVLKYVIVTYCLSFIIISIPIMIIIPAIVWILLIAILLSLCTNFALYRNIVNLYSCEQLYGVLE